MKLSSEKLESVLEQIDVGSSLTIIRHFQSLEVCLATTRSLLMLAVS
jgi:hypothetical protein